jgi:arginyl-tRNA synthetase (EC 6.1.1.19)
VSTLPALEQNLIDWLSGALTSIAPEYVSRLTLERTRQANHGDYASPIALQLAKSLRLPPREVAQRILALLPPSVLIDHVELAGAGFINIFLSSAARQSVVMEILNGGSLYAQSDQENDRRVLVEFVSSNPTGPLHVGHGRGAAYGASLCNILEKAGYQVHREYYVNDAGRQMDILTVSTWLRALNNTGKLSFPFPANGYQGDYVLSMAQDALDRFSLGDTENMVSALLHACPGLNNQDTGDEEAQMDCLIASAKTLLGDIYQNLHAFVLAQQLSDCRDDLQEFGVVFDEWFSEQSLFDSGSVAKIVERLSEAGHLYRDQGALWFRSTAFGDEKDRVVQRDNGLYTYFASDIAYHVNKFERGFDRLINVWGADHHGYIPRVEAALIALGYDVAHLSVPLVQFVSLFRQGEKAQMSTRKGQFVTLRHLREEVGRDAARLFYVLRKSDQHLDFDLDLARAQSQDNPVYYIQYAHARISRVLERWGGNTDLLHSVDLSALIQPEEVELFQILRAYPVLIQQAAQELAPHLLAFYLRDLAASFHGYYNAVPFLDCPEALARLALLKSIQIVLRDGLTLLGVSAPDVM